MLVKKKILVWKNAPSLEELLPLVCDDQKTIEAEFTEMTKMGDGTLVPKGTYVTLTLAKFSMEHEDQHESFPVALGAVVKSVQGDCSAVAGCCSVGDSIRLLYHPGHQLAVVKQIHRYEGTWYGIPVDNGTDEAEEACQNFMSSLSRLSSSKAKA